MSGKAKKKHNKSKRIARARSVKPYAKVNGTTQRGRRMTPGRGWRLSPTKGSERVFVATLLEIINIGGQRLAIFSVPK